MIQSNYKIIFNNRIILPLENKIDLKNLESNI